MLTLRNEIPADYARVYEINRLAFDGSDAEPQLVDAIRRSPGAISLVADEDGRVVGHILLSPITIETEGGSLPAMSLAPMAVHPDFQKRGIGSALVRAGLDACREQGHAIVIVLGHIHYYPRFGFSAGLAQGLKCPFGDCGEAWMALELVPGALAGVTGNVIYPKAFESV